MTDSKRYRMTVSEAAEYLGLSVRAIYRKVESGELDHLRTFDSTTTRVVNGETMTVRVSGRLKFSEAGLDAWIAAHRSPARQAAPAAAPAPPAIAMPATRRFS